jgi:RNA polymerase sigma-70 factor (ECF subfamily)
VTPHSLDEAVALARSGDQSAFETIYRELAAPLLSYLATRVRRPHDAEDLLGQVFLEAIRGIGRFSGDGGALRAWLFRIARDRAVDLARRQTRRPEGPLEEALNRPAQAGTEQEALARVETGLLLRAVAALPPKQREVLALRLASGLSSSEIASVLGKRVGAIKALQHRAIANLTKALVGGAPSPDEEDEPSELGGEEAGAVPPPGRSSL